MDSEIKIKNSLEASIQLLDFELNTEISDPGKYVDAIYLYLLVQIY